MKLPNYFELRRRCIALALLDCALCRDWTLRYFLFDPNWDENESLASMRGMDCGYFIVFAENLCFCKLFPRRKNAIEVDKLPDNLKAYAEEPAFDVISECQHAWFYCDEWKVDFSSEIAPVMDFLIGGSDVYVDYATRYFEEDVETSYVEAVFREPTVDNVCAPFSKNKELVFQVKQEFRWL